MNLWRIMLSEKTNPKEIFIIWFHLYTTPEMIRFQKQRTDWIASGQGFPGGWDSKESAGNVGDRGSIPGLGKTPAEENENPL